MSKKTKQIVKQVDFYFSDSNLPRDKFLTELVSKSEEGWCPIETIASFQRMKKITTDLSEVVEALRTSDFLVVSEDGVSVRRKEPLVEQLKDNLDESVYVKGLPEAWELDDVQNFVEKQLQEGEALCLTRMRRFKGGDKDKQFKGSVFLEFNKTETADRFAGLTLKVEEGGADLLVMKKAAYAAKKKEEYSEKKAKKAGAGEDGEEKGKGGKGKGGKGKGGKGQKRKAEDEAKEPVETPKDMIISLSGLGGGECSREVLKEAIEAAGCTVQYIEYARGSDAGYIRLSEDSALKATAACEKITADAVEIAGVKPVAKALAGDEETEYWAKVSAAKKNRKSGHKKKRN